MDTYSSGEDLLIKARKPYTITKQRERWTDEEHNRFLEALKLYGRAWQRIEEHIGTKTAVQIRSHAQKFFSKLEKEALVKGVPIGQALDIDIPPPRPKRKPSNPYPRKTSVAVPLTQIGPKDSKLLISVSSSHYKHVLDMEKKPLPEHLVNQRLARGENSTNRNESKNENCSEVFNLIQEAHCSSVSSVAKNYVPTSQALRNSCSFMEVVPLEREGETEKETNEYFPMERNGNQKLDKSDWNKIVEDSGKTEFSNIDHPVQNLFQCEKLDNSNCTLPMEEMQANHNFPRHVSVHVIDTNIGTSSQTPFADMSVKTAMPHPRDHGHSNLFPNPAASAFAEHQNSSTESFIHRSFSTFHLPYTSVCQNQDDYQTLLHLSSTFSSLIVSTLQQNPAAHATASFAQFCPYANAETSVDSPANTQGGYPSRQMNSAPSMAAIASATVAAATAWWAAHGLLPLCSPQQSAFTCSSALTNAVPSVETGHGQPREPERSEAFQPQHLASKSSALSSSDSEEIRAKVTNCSKASSNNEKAAAVTELHDPNNTKGREKVDRSSCGSNRGSSSDVDGDALEKHEKGNGDENDLNANNPSAESSRRTRSSSILNDSWKEVSEGGRLAFQALFSRDRLPQSFSPHCYLTNGEHQMNNLIEYKHKTDEKDRDALLLDLNNKIWVSCSDHQGTEDIYAPSRAENDGKNEILTMGLGQGKLKFCRTGFKPYKRCSMEAKEIMMQNASHQDEEKGPKRICLEGEASA